MIGYLLEGKATNVYLDGENTYMWAKDLRETHDIGLLSERSPLIKHRDSLPRGMRDSCSNLGTISAPSKICRARP